MEYYKIIAYLIGEHKYKRLSISQYVNKRSVIREYRSLLNKYAIKSNKEFVIVMLDNENRILTAWAIETPTKLLEAAELALSTFEKDGEKLFIDKNLKLINLFGSQVYDEIIAEGKRLEIIPENYLEGIEDDAIEDATEEAIEGVESGGGTEFNNELD